MGDVFISYKQDERERMRPIADGLRALGVDVWFDERLQPDRSFTEEIQEVMHGCRAQIVCWSPAAVASEWVRGEAEVARQRGVLVAVMIEPCALPPPFNMHHAESLVGWTGDARHPGWRKICDVVGRRIGRPGLGEFAALQGVNEGAAWKKWAQKFPDDPKADEAWAIAEDLDVAAARERLARERAAPKPATPRAAPPASVPSATQDPPPKHRRSIALVAGGAVLCIAAASAVYFLGLAPKPAAVAVNDVSESEPVMTPADSGAADAAATSPPPPQRAAETPSSVTPRDVVTEAMGHIRALTTEEWYAINVFSSGILREPGVVEALQSSAYANDPRVLTIIAYGYFGGRGGAPRSIEDAHRLLRRAAEQGFAPAQHALAVELLPRSRSEAVRWWRAAADQGHPQAQQSLAFALASGDGVTADRAEAIRYFKLAARHPSGGLSRDWLSEAGETW